MNRRRESSIGEVTEVLKRYLRRGVPVHIDGLGLFLPDEKGRYHFTPETAPKVFIAYADEDAGAAERIYLELKRQGYRPWLDRKMLRPGQNWPRAIERAIGISDFVIACFSHQSASKRGVFQSELRYALDCATRLPLDQIFLIPVRLDDCLVPHPIRTRLQYVDLFPDWAAGLRRVLAALSSRRSLPSARAGPLSAAPSPKA